MSVCRCVTAVTVNAYFIPFRLGGGAGSSWDGIPVLTGLSESKGALFPDRGEWRSHRQE